MGGIFSEMFGQRGGMGGGMGGGGRFAAATARNSIWAACP